MASFEVVTAGNELRASQDGLSPYMRSTSPDGERNNESMKNSFAGQDQTKITMDECIEMDKNINTPMEGKYSENEYKMDQHSDVIPNLSDVDGQSKSLTNDQGVLLPHRIISTAESTDHSRRSSFGSDHEIVEAVLPNLRDLAVSSGLSPQMKEGVLFRSARHFASSQHTLKEVICDKLNIRSVIDLRDDDLTPSRTELLSRTLLMRLFGLQMPIRMSRKTERAFRQLERISDGLQEQVTCHPPVHEGTHLEYVKGRTVVSPGVVERSVAEMNSIALKQKQTELNQGQVHERLQPRSAEELKHSRLSLEDQSRFQEFLFHSSPITHNKAVEHSFFISTPSSSSISSKSQSSMDCPILNPSSSSPSLLDAISNPSTNSPCLSEVKSQTKFTESLSTFNHSESAILPTNSDPIKPLTRSWSESIVSPSKKAETKNGSAITHSSVAVLPSPSAIPMEKNEANDRRSCVHLDADTTLQLTHDTTRQAYESRRRSSGSSYSEWYSTADIPRKTTNPLTLAPGSSGSTRRPSFGSILAFERQYRKLYIINVLNSPGVKERVREEIAGSYALPLMLVAKITDKITGSSYAPYYFCKYFVSMHDILESYIEMIKYCGENFCQVLKVITLAEPPVLFHCTLGKDRTGIVAMLLLSVLGASDENIIYDYSLTEQAGEAFQAFSYDFIVKESGLSEQFTSATEQTARETLAFIRRSWGSVDGYLDWIGFDQGWRDGLQKKFLNDVVPTQK